MIKENREINIKDIQNKDLYKSNTPSITSISLRSGIKRPRHGNSTLKTFLTKN